jgi:hypothetical protein
MTKVSLLGSLVRALIEKKEETSIVQLVIGVLDRRVPAR